jgi:hypothetical protein
MTPRERCLQAIAPLRCGAEFSCDERGQTIPPARHHRKRGRHAALLVSALTYLLPDSLLYKPISQVTEATGKKETEHLIFRIKRLEIKSREASDRPAGTTWEQALSTAAVALGLLAITFAVFGVVFREEKLLAGIAATLGATAIAVQVWWVLLVVVFAMVIANVFLS